MPPGIIYDVNKECFGYVCRGSDVDCALAWIGVNVVGSLSCLVDDFFHPQSGGVDDGKGIFSGLEGQDLEISFSRVAFAHIGNHAPGARAVLSVNEP